jgi:hypothetical protein
MSEFLEVHRDNAQATIVGNLPLAADGRLSYGELVEFCENYRIHGIACLLLDADPEGLHVGLHDGGQAFAHGVARLDRQQIVLSQATPLFDAVACGGTALAAKIAALLAVEWQSDVEYQDDYLYFDVIRQWVLARQFADDVSNTVDALAAVAAASDPRLLVCQALRARDDVAFESALRSLVERHEHRYEMLVDRARLSDDVAATFPFLCVEGLALLRIAEATGIELEDDYPLIPSIAQGNFTASFSATGWLRRA